MIPSVPARICYSYFKLAGSFKVSMAHENGSKIQENSIEFPLQCLGFETILSVLVSWKYLRGHNSISTVGGIFWSHPVMGQRLVIVIKPKLVKDIHLRVRNSLFPKDNFFWDTLYILVFLVSGECLDLRVCYHWTASLVKSDLYF